MTDPQPKTARLVVNQEVPMPAQQYKLSVPIGDGIDVVSALTDRCDQTVMVELFAGPLGNTDSPTLIEVECLHVEHIPPITAADILRAWGYEVQS